MSTEVFVRDYIQVAHRLTALPGKCTNIHGHSMLVTMTLRGIVDRNGLVVDVKSRTVLDFSEVKKVFRGFLSANYDHRLLLNKDDPWAKLLGAMPDHEGEAEYVIYNRLPGLVQCEGDPTVENIAKWVFESMALGFPVSKITVQETATNGVTYSEDS